MPDILGTILVLTVLAAVVFLAARSLWKTHKQGGHCTGNCGACRGCHSAPPSSSPRTK